MNRKIYYITLLTILFLSCNQTTKKEVEKTIPIDNQEEILIDNGQCSFNFSEFTFELDSLLAIYENNKYSFKLISDTIDTKTTNNKLIQFKNGLFGELYSVSLESLKVHHYFVPNTKKILRIYLIEAEYSDSIKCIEKIDILKKKSQSTSLPFNDNGDRLIIGLTFTNDFLIRQENKIYWLNVACQYSEREYFGFIQCLKTKLNNTNKSDTIICFCDGICKY